MSQTQGNGGKVTPEETAPTHRGRTMERVRMALRFLLTGFTIWIIYDVLMLLIGGTSAGFGTGWLKWNYLRWMETALDGLVGLHMFQCFFSPAFCAAVSSSLIFDAKRTRASKGTILLLWPAAIALQCIFLLNAFQSGGSRFWWPTPGTYIPASTVGLFEISTTILWLTTPFLSYWVTLFVRYLWKKRHRLPPETPPVEETHLS